MSILTPITAEVQEWQQQLAEGPAKEAVLQLQQTIRNAIPMGFEEGISYGMVGYYVPYTIYPAGYHCTPRQPLPFASLALQKSHIALYHMGIYADEALLEWFVSEHAAASPHKLDMGKSCIRYKKPDQIPFELVGRLMSKMTPEDWILIYESQFRKTK
jgi:hypothetical protein